MALVYKSGGQSGISFNVWSAVVASAIPALLIAPSVVPMGYLFHAYGAIFLPTFYGLFDRMMRRRVARSMADEIYLFENGE